MEIKDTEPDVAGLPKFCSWCGRPAKIKIIHRITSYDRDKGTPNIHWEAVAYCSSWLYRFIHRELFYRIGDHWERAMADD